MHTFDTRSLDAPLRLGMLTPSSNSVLEPVTFALASPLGDAISVHFSRFRVLEIGLGERANSQFQDEAILAAADLLADARPAVIAWNGTSASWLGFERDETLCGVIEERTGTRATSAILGLNAALRRRNVRRLGLVTPYTPDVQDRIIANYARCGVEVVSERHESLSENFAFATVPEERVAQMCRAVAQARPDAIAIVCTNMRGALVAAQIERETGVPVFDSVALTLRACLDAAGLDPRPLARFGTLFADGVERAP